VEPEAEAPSLCGNPVDTGRKLMGRYEILGEPGRGGMGVVYRCRDSIGGVDAALKALPPEIGDGLYPLFIYTITLFSWLRSGRKNVRAPVLRASVFRSTPPHTAILAETVDQGSGLASPARGWPTSASISATQILGVFA
jgi:hypothetical protein